MQANTLVELSKHDRQLLSNFHKSWPLRLFLDSMKPYMELIRIHRPAGIMMFYFPCLYGSFLVANLSNSLITTIPDMVSTNAKLLVLGFLLRGTLCTYNDIIDQDLDRQVARTRIRPIARNAISTRKAWAWTLIQVAITILFYNRLLPNACLNYSLPFFGFHLLYPFAKRFTDHPQIILGLAHSLGIFISFPVLGQALYPFDAATTTTNTTTSTPTSTEVLVPQTNNLAAYSFTAAIIFWTLLNDTIYSAQDLADDIKIGIGSTMVHWGESARGFLRILGMAQMAALCVVMVAIRETAPLGGVVYAALTCGFTALGVLGMVEWVDLKDPVSCGWWFNRGNVLIGYAMGSGLVGEYLIGRIWAH